MKIKDTKFLLIFLIMPILVGFFLLFNAPPVSAAVNLIANPSLETDADANGLPDGWFTGNWGTNSAVFSYPVAGSDGAAAAKVAISSYSSGDAKWYFQDVPVTAGQLYDFSDSYQATVSTSLVARYSDAGGNFTYAYLTDMTPSTGWQTVAVGLTPPAGTVSLTVFHLLVAVGSLTVDNFNLTQFTPPPPPPVDPSNLIANPSLEVDANNDKLPDQWFKGGWGTNKVTFSYPVAGSDGLRAAQVTISSYTDGDAKWYFQDLAVTPGQQYRFQDDYQATVPTTVVLRYTSTANAVSYVGLGSLAAAAGWQTASYDFIVPAGVSSLTIFHLLNAVGTLTVDNFRLAADNTPNPDLFDQGFVSLTFDDGWKSQYNKAKPILDAAGLKSTFYIISQEIANSVQSNLILNPSLEIDADKNKVPDQWSTNQTGVNNAKFTYPVTGVNGGVAARIDATVFLSGEAKWLPASVAVDANRSYTFHDRYLSTANSRVTALIKRSNGTTQTLQLGTVKAASVWTTVNFNFTTPANAISLTIYHALIAKGSLTIDDFSLTASTNSDPNYMSGADVLSLQADGQEIGSHTQTHPDLTTLSTAQVQAEIVGSRNDLLSLGITSVTSLAYPYGTYNSQVEQLVSSAGYTSARTVDGGYNNKATNKFELKTQAVVASTTPDEIKAWIDQAKVSKTWLVLVFHQIDEAGQEYGTTSTVLQGIIDYLKNELGRDTG